MKKSFKNNPYKTYMMLWTLGLSFVFFTAAIIQSWSKFSDIYKLDFIHFILSVSLSIVTFFLFISYSIQTYRELNLLNDYLDGNFSPRVKSRTYLTIIFLALFFGILISISHLILIFSIIIVFYNLCDVWGGWQVSKTIRPLIDRKLAMDDCIEEKEIIKTLKLYYFGNPTLQRVITIMFCNWIAVCMSLIFYFDHNPLFRNIAYSLIILNLII